MDRQAFMATDAGICAAFFGLALHNKPEFNKMFFQIMKERLVAQEFPEDEVNELMKGIEEVVEEFRTAVELWEEDGR